MLEGNLKGHEQIFKGDTYNSHYTNNTYWGDVFGIEKDLEQYSDCKYGS